MKCSTFFRDDLDNREVVVTIRCITFNHEKYIGETLEGFVNQKTNFRFEAIVHDDASTDGTAEIIQMYAEKYPSIIKPIFETENQYSKKDGSINRIMAAYSRGKYVAYCEGDDYWTDPLKLQKQVDFLDSHPEYGLVSCGFSQYFQSLDKFGPTLEYENQDLSYDDLLIINRIGTLTVCVKKEILDMYGKMYADEYSKWSYGDYPIWIFAASQARIRQFGEIMAVYRVLEKSASHLSSIKQKLNWVKTRYEVYDLMSKLAPVSEGTYYKAEYNRARLSWYVVALAKDKTLLNRVMKFYNENGFRKQALITKCMYLFPRLKRLWFYLDAKFAPTPRVYR